MMGSWNCLAAAGPGPLGSGGERRGDHLEQAALAAKKNTSQAWKKSQWKQSKKLVTCLNTEKYSLL